MNNYVKLSDICKISGRVGWKGYTVNDLRTEGPWVIGANDITDDNILDLTEAKHISREKFEESPEIKIELNDILIVKVGSTIGKIAIVDREIGEACINPNTVLLKNCKIDPYYLYCYLISSAGQQYIKNHSSASAQPALNQTDLKEMPIRLVDIDVQNKVSHQLKIFNKKIAINNKINRELEALAKTIYDYWFVQFDFPNNNGKPYKSSRGKMVYNKELKREIPEGWEDSTISDWIENDKNGDWGKEQEEGNYTEKVSCIRGADINGLNGNGEVKSPTRYILEKNTHKILEAGDLIVEISGGSPTQSTGRLAFITEETLDRFENPLICSNFCKAVTLKDETYLYNFVYNWNRLYNAGVLFGWEGKTSGIKNLLFENFITSYKVVKPPIEIIEQFYNKVKVLHQKKQKNLLENQKLAVLRDWLLPMLMNGQVRVGDEILKQAQDDKVGMVAEEGNKYKS
ncbi:restriction endonuclease subunit S [Abyssalbus ytuae]|uniref:Restriction endonuclease subunit S n=1 Tax=Abyssalbus ytuae TaxID=2926907 RepID=A0A9E6ZRX3_9FLAO|nr:restriction endonuclease subunit S [Abyssalbus ytuae]UOB19355.1 restriction endonuclease subunit S [Abyssalbus ytuae]